MNCEVCCRPVKRRNDKSYCSKGCRYRLNILRWVFRDLERNGTLRVAYRILEEISGKIIPLKPAASLEGGSAAAFFKEEADKPNVREQQVSKAAQMKEWLEVEKMFKDAK